MHEFVAKELKVMKKDEKKEEGIEVSNYVFFLLRKINHILTENMLMLPHLQDLLVLFLNPTLS